ncbi:MAG TPA: DUF4232 domain-containing protein [Candidatus Elarobacter sp.]|jgi:hypothetical protein|nr:DUF4232 domain-containing protein [Candidatus Elarobacter sp.]
MNLRPLIPALAALATTTAATASAAPLPPIGGAHGPLAILRPCAASQLKASIASDQSAMMHRELHITLTNTGSTGCAIDGYPAVRLLDELGHPRITAESFSRTPRLFVLSPGQQAAFGLRIATGDGTTTYITAPTLAVIPPGDVKPLRLHVTLPVAPVLDVTAVLPLADFK